MLLRVLVDLGSMLQRSLKRIQRLGVVLFAGVNDPQQVVALDAGGISLQLFFGFLFGFLDRALLEQCFRFGERRRSLADCAVCSAAGIRLLRSWEPWPLPEASPSARISLRSRPECSRRDCMPN